MYISFARLLAFGAALLGMAALYLFLTRPFMRTAIRAIAQDREIMVLMGVTSRRVYLMTPAICGDLAARASRPLSRQYALITGLGTKVGPCNSLTHGLGGL